MITRLDAAAIELGRYTMLSLDVFDTALHRRVLDPVAAFQLVPAADATVLDALAAHWSVAPDAVGQRFATARIAAERAARADTSADDVTFEQITAALAATELLDADLAGRLAGLELSVERSLLLANDDALQLAAQARSLGLRVAFVSDMYLPPWFIREQLVANGFDVDLLLVSSDVGRTKASGGLFDHLVRRSGVDAARIVHVGDSIRADWVMARRAGLGAVLVGRPARRLRSRRALFAVPTESASGDAVALGLAAPVLLRLHEPRPGDPAIEDSIGYGVLGPAIAGFADWLEHLPRPDDVQRLAFCSRDGAMLLDAWSARQRPGSPDTTYLHVSRRALWVPALAGGIDESHREWLTTARALTGRQALSRLGLDPDEFRHELATGGFELDAPIPLTRADRDRLFTVLQRIEPAVVEQAAHELDELWAYLRTVIGPGERIELVDVGWRATLQEALGVCVRLLGLDLTVDGSYLALLRQRPLTAPGHTNAMLSRDGTPWLVHGVLSEAIPVVELMLQAGHGSVVDYRDGEPVLADGADDRSVIDPLQAAARRFLQDLAALDPPDPLTPGAAVPLLRLLAQPPVATARRLGGYQHAEGFGGDAPRRPIVPAHIGHHPLALVEALRTSEWRPGVVAGLGSPPSIAGAAAVGLAALRQVVPRLRSRPSAATMSSQ